MYHLFLQVKKLLKENKKVLLQNLNRAKKYHGIIPVTFLKVIVSGSAAAGKTNFINLLMKKQFNKEHFSTNVVHANHAVSFQMAAFQGPSDTENDEITWVELDSNLETGYLQSVLLPKTLPKPLPKPKLPVTSTEMANNSDSAKVPPGSIEATSEPQYQSKTPKQQQPSLLNWLTGLFSSSIKDSNLSTIGSILSLKSSQSSAPIYEPGKVLKVITLLDTGGQPEYIHLLPTININPTITFVVHDLSKSLYDQVLVECRKHGKHILTPYHLSYSNFDMIKFLMSAVNDSAERSGCTVPDPQLAVTPGSDDKSYICIIGTHTDKVLQSDIKHANEKITNLVNATESHASVWYQENKNILFSVDNTTAGSKDREDPLAKNIRNRIETLATKKEVYELPVTWMLFQLEVRQICSKREKSYILFSDCVAIAKESNLISNIEEVKSVLQYYHILGVLIYFHKIPGLCNYVIVDHQWWFDKLSRVICITFQEDFLTYKAVKKLKYQGLLSKDLLKNIQWNDDIKEEYFFSLLTEMKIVTPIVSKLDGAKEYFIPFALSAYNLQCENEILSQYGHLQGEPLLIQFHSGLLPRGLFCSLIVQLLQYPFKGSEPHFSQEDKQHAFSNLFSFSLSNAYSMSLVDKLSYLEVQIRHSEKSFHVPIHAEVYSYLMYVLTDVCSNLKFDFERLRCGFLCKCRKYTGDHIAILPSTSSSIMSTMTHAKCSIDSTHQMKLSSSHMIWFHDDQPILIMKGRSIACWKCM